MKSINKYTINVRRQSFIKSIRNEQRQQIKARKRADFIQKSNIYDYVWRFKISIHTLNLYFEEVRVIDFLQFLQQHSHSQQFCYHIINSHILEQLIQVITSSLLKNPLLQIPLLIEKVFDLIYHLMARSNIFLRVIEKQFNHFVFALFMYPNSQNNLDKVSQFFTCIDYISSSKLWKDNYLKTKLVQEEAIIQKLMSIYIYQNCYTVTEGHLQMEVKKSSLKWFRNAIKCLQIVYSLIQIHQQRSAIWQTKTVKESLYEGLYVFINKKEFYIEKIDSETDSETMSQMHEQTRHFESEQTNLYFISLILDILLIKEELLQQRQVEILKGILQILLKQLNKYSIINLTAIKIIKILYEQVIFAEDDLIELANNYGHLTDLIASIVENDIL